MGQPDGELRGAVIRALTEGERALAREVFADAIHLDHLRLIPSPRPFDRAFTAGRWFGRDWIVWPHRTLAPDISVEPLGLQAILIHELVHVWQAQQGVSLILGKLRAGDRPASYAYPVIDDCVWADLNIEQQAMVVEHRFRLSRGGGVPADRAFYDRVCPLPGGEGRA